MEVTKEKGRKGNLISQTWKRCKSLGRGSKTPSPSQPSALAHVQSAPKSKSWPSVLDAAASSKEGKKRPRKRRAAPEGCFSVYVGPQKQRFVIKTECANHPLFRILLEEAESEYGYNSEGPLALPCNVDIFYKVLMEMDQIDDRETTMHYGCVGFVKNKPESYRLLSQPRLIAMNQFQ